MKAKINKDACIGCGACTMIAKDFFCFGSDGLAEVKEEIEKKDEEEMSPVPEELEEDVRSAMDSCPTGAVEVEE